MKEIDFFYIYSACCLLLTAAFLVVYLLLRWKEATAKETIAKLFRELTRQVKDVRRTAGNNAHEIILLKRKFWDIENEKNKNDEKN